VTAPYIEESDERNDEFRIKVIRDQPFRSTSNDCAQVTSRCNIDFQFLLCAPTGLEVEADACQLAAASKGSRKWLYGTNSAALEPGLRAAFEKSFAAAFRKQFAMDFYMTKYQGKQMEALTPLFQAMLGGVHRLEEQEREWERQAKDTATDGADGLQAGRPVKKRRLQEDLARRARRLTVRLAAMANRCYWLSATEVAVHILTGGDCLQTHNHQRLFTRQLQWAFHECKRLLNGEGAAEEAPGCQPNIEAVKVQFAGGAPQPAAGRRKQSLR
jgi:hypothetical protein